MGGLPNRTRLRDSRYPVLVLVLVLSILGSPLARAQRERTDVILLDNGDRVTGEIEQLEHGLLRVRTNSMGRVDIEWENVEQVTSNYLFEVELSNGDRHVGSILPSDDKQHVDVRGEAGPVKLERMSVIRIAQLENRFWQRWDGSLDVGFSFLRANRLSTWNLGFQGSYRLPDYVTNVRADSNVSDQKNSEKTTRHTFQLDGTCRRMTNNTSMSEARLVPSSWNACRSFASPSWKTGSGKGGTVPWTWGSASCGLTG